MDQVKSRRPWSPDDLLAYFFISLQMRSSGAMAEVCRDLRDMALKRFQLDGPGGTPCPHKITSQRMFLRVDVAFMLWQQERLATLQHRPRFLMADASPQGGREWLLGRHVTLSARSLAMHQAAHAVVCRSMDTSRRACKPSDEELGRIDFLRDNLPAHAMPPAAMGLARTTATHKGAALLHSLSLEARPSELQGCLLSVLSLTADLGPEIGIPGFRSNYQELLPPWRQQWVQKLVADHGIAAAEQRVAVDVPVCSLQVDGDCCEDPTWEDNALQPDGDGWVSQGAEQGQGEEHSAEHAATLSSAETAFSVLHAAWLGQPTWHTVLLPFAMAVPGMLHVLSNLLRDTDTSMEGWDDFWAYLKNVAALLCDRHRLNKFRAKCLDGLPDGGRWQRVFAKPLDDLYDKRWGCVTRFLRKSAPKVAALKRVWRHDLYGDSEEQHEVRFLPEQLTRDLQNPFWGAFGDSVLMVHGIVETFRGWCEGCTCHPPTAKEGTSSLDMSSKQRQSSLGGKQPCPLQGLHAPEIAAGRWRTVLEELRDLSARQLAIKHRGHLNSDSAI